MASSDQPKVRAAGDSSAPYAVHASDGFAGWLYETGSSLAVSTYQIGKVFLIGADSPATLVVSERNFDRCLGLAPDGQGGLLLAARSAIYRFVNVVPPGREVKDHDALYVPRQAWFTGDVHAHDVAAGPGGRPIFINTLFSCLATVDADTSFRKIWQPSFVSALRPEDRCHLNGLATDDAGTPRYVTAVAETDGPRAWTEHRTSGGVVIDLTRNEVVCRGLSMPHSPRLHDGQLYVAQAGTGEVCRVDLDRGLVEPVAFLPGFVRGLAFFGGYAAVGLSLPRASPVFAGLPLEQRLKEAGFAPQCAIAIVDLASGEAVHVLRLGGVVRELYDIAVLKGQRRPGLVGLSAGGELDHLVTRGPDFSLSSPTA